MLTTLDVWLDRCGASMRDVCERARTLARDSDAPVLIVGERGSGRRTLGGLIHRASGRRDGSVLTFDGHGLPPTLILSELFGHTQTGFDGAYRDKRGLLWRVHGGSLIVADIMNLPADVQIALDEFLGTRQIVPVGASASIGMVDVRLIATTSAHSDRGLLAGPFLQTLSQRVQHRTIIIPPLRERREDILALFDAFVRVSPQEAPALRLTKDAEQLLLSYDWPGNIIELREVVTRLLLGAGEGALTTDDVADALVSNRMRAGSGNVPLP